MRFFQEAVQDIAATVTFVLPGFLAVSMHEVTNPSLSRDRLALQWTMWSLFTSLMIYPAMYGIYSAFDWPREPLQYQFYIPLLAGAVVVGYLSGRIVGSELGKKGTARLRLFLRAWVWVEVLSEKFPVNIYGKPERPARHVTVYLKNGTILFGFPAKYTDDRREQTRELFLTWPMRWDPEKVAFVEIPDSQGVLVESTNISYISFRQPVDITSSET